MLGALVAAVPRQLTALDEGGEVRARDLHLDPAVLHFEDFAGHDRALPVKLAVAAGLLASFLAAKGSLASCSTPMAMRSFSTSTSSTLAVTLSPFL